MKQATKQLLWLAPVLAASLASPALAQTGSEPGTWQTTAQFTPVSKLLSGSGAQGYLAGLTETFFVSERVYWGLGGYAGKTGDDPIHGRSFWLGGVLVGLSTPAIGGWNADLSVMGGGSMSRAIGPTLEPVLTLNREFGRGVSAGLSLGYLQTFAQAETNGPTVGLQVRFKTLLSGLAD